MENFFHNNVHIKYYVVYIKVYMKYLKRRASKSRAYTMMVCLSHIHEKSPTNGS